MRTVRLIFISLFVLLVGLSTVFASDTRISNLGYQANFYVRDDYNIWAFPSTIVDYNNLIIAESSYPYEQLWSGGIHLPISPSFTLGVYVRKDTLHIRYADTNFLGREIFYEDLESAYNAAQHQFTIFGGFRLENVNLGLSVTTYSSKLTYTDPNDADSGEEDMLGARDITFGISTKMNERSRLDASIFYGTGTFKHYQAWQDPTQLYKPYGYSEWGIGARLFYAMNEKTIIIPFLMYGSGGQGWQYMESDPPDGTLLTYKDKYSMYTVGCGVNLMPIEKTLITLAVGYDHLSGTYEETYKNADAGLPSKGSYSALPFLSIGLGKRINKWLGARFSFYELLETQKGEFDADYNDPNTLEEWKLTGSTYSAQFGLWFELGRFKIDCLVDTDGDADFLHRGLYVLSGNSRELFSKISITFDFNENVRK